MSVWVALRGFGIGSLWLLNLSMATGFLLGWASSRRPRWVPALAYLHTSFSVAGWAGGLVHGVLLRYDAYMPFTWKQLLIPFQSPYRPLWTTLGILALYGWGLVLLSFDGRRRLGAGLFRALHQATPAMAVMAALHSLGAGSDPHLAAVGWAARLALALGAAALVAHLRRSLLARQAADGFVLQRHASAPGGR